MNFEKVAVFGVPRSGTSWLGQIYNSHPEVLFRFQPLFSYTHKGRLDNKSTKVDVDKFFEELVSSQDEFALMKSKMHEHYPSFSKTEKFSHVVFKETRYLNIIPTLLEESADLKIVGIIRNPLGVLASWIRAPKEFNCNWNILDEWQQGNKKNKGRQEEFYGYEKWKEASLEFLRLQKRFPAQLTFIRYSDLLKDSTFEIERIFKFCNLSFDSQVQRFLLESRKKQLEDTYSVFKSRTSDEEWIDVLPKRIVEEIYADLIGTPLEIFLEN